MQISSASVARPAVTPAGRRYIVLALRGSRIFVLHRRSHPKEAKKKTKVRLGGATRQELLVPNPRSPWLFYKWIPEVGWSLYCALCKKQARHEWDVKKHGEGPLSALVFFLQVLAPTLHGTVL